MSWKSNWLAARLSEGQIAGFIEDDEVRSGEIFREASLTARPRLGLQPCDEFDGVEKSAALSGANAISGDGYGEMRLAGSGKANERAIERRAKLSLSSSHALNINRQEFGDRLNAELLLAPRDFGFVMLRVRADNS